MGKCSGKCTPDSSDSRWVWNVNVPNGWLNNNNANNTNPGVRPIL